MADSGNTQIKLNTWQKCALTALGFMVAYLAFEFFIDHNIDWGRTILLTVIFTALDVSTSVYIEKKQKK